MFEVLFKEYIESSLKISLYPSFGIGKLPIFTYTHTPITSGHIKQSQYEIKVIDKDLDNTFAYRDKLIQLLSFKENASAMRYKNLYFTSTLSGGGQIFNDSIQVWELSLIFIVKWRMIK